MKEFMVQFDHSEALLPQKAPPVSSPKESFLHFYLEEGVGALVALQHSVEVLNIARKDILPFFFMPAWVTGVYNLKGEILWIVDLAHLLGLTASYRQKPRLDFTVLVLQATQTNPAAGRIPMLGCLIHQLESIEYCNPHDFSAQQPSAIKYSIPPAFLQGYWTKSGTETLAVLDINAIVESLSQRHLR